MIDLLIMLIVVLVVVSLALWIVSELAPAELQRPLRIIIIALCVVFLLVRLLPLLGIS